MGRFSSFLGQTRSCQASKAATDAVWATGNGTAAYGLGGKIFIGCGIGWVLRICAGMGGVRAFAVTAYFEAVGYNKSN